MMCADGLKRATLTALLSANYIAQCLREKYPVLYRGANGFVAHECIIDAGQFKKTAGVSVEDIAKRLGWTLVIMRRPCHGRNPGAIMIEPTESESKYELDKFCDAMLAIEKEIARIAAGEWPRENNPLVCAPHVAEDVFSDDWNRPYSREEAVIRGVDVSQQILAAGISA